MGRMLAVVTLGVALGATWFGAEARAADLLVRDARLIDGTGVPPRAPVSILIRDGRIAEIAPVIRADGTPALDAGGATVLPRPMDMHVHFIPAPGAGFRGDSRDTTLGADPPQAKRQGLHDHVLRASRREHEGRWHQA